MAKNWTTLPDAGQLLVSTDLHGNGDDFRQLRKLFLEKVGRGEEIHWAILGDLVHGPDEQARSFDPPLYDFDDESFAIVQGATELLDSYPSQVHLVLGNHDHSHVGGAPVAKFYPDEGAHLEAGLTEEQKEQLRALFRRAHLLLLTHCGALLCHGSPGEILRDVHSVDRLSFDINANSPIQNRLLSSMLTSYGQRPEVTARMLQKLSASAGVPLTFVIHGHDRDNEGFFVDGDNQLCPVLFGAPRENKRYVLIDLSTRYEDAKSLRDGVEILRLFG